MGKLDIVALADNGVVSVFQGLGDGTFGPRADYGVGGGTLYQAAIADINGDGYPDVVAANFDYNRVTTLLGGPGGGLTSRIDYGISGNPICVALEDFNHDGRLDLASANYNGSTVTVFLGNAGQSVASDPAGTGLRIVAARGNVADGGDLDYWTFSAAAGQGLLITTENPGSPYGSSLLYRIYGPDWNQWNYFYTDTYGRYQGTFTVPASGTYRVRVEQSDAYAGEYRFRLTLANPPVQLETEDNGTLASADAVSLTLTNGQRIATMLGTISTWDGGDYYQFGNLG